MQNPTAASCLLRFPGILPDQREWGLAQRGTAAKRTAKYCTPVGGRRIAALAGRATTIRAWSPRRDNRHQMVAARTVRPLSTFPMSPPRVRIDGVVYFTGLPCTLREMQGQDLCPAIIEVPFIRRLPSTLVTVPRAAVGPPGSVVRRRRSVRNTKTGSSLAALCGTALEIGGSFPTSIQGSGMGASQTREDPPVLGGVIWRHATFPWLRNPVSACSWHLSTCREASDTGVSSAQAVTVGAVSPPPRDGRADTGREDKGDSQWVAHCASKRYPSRGIAPAPRTT